MGNTVEALAHKADVKSRMKESISDKTERFRNQMSGTTSRISDATPDRERVSEGAQQAVGIAQENPIGLAIGGVAAGFLAGMLLPTTKIEDERVGPVADQVKDKAKETGQEALERGKEVATQVAEQASETAKEAGQQHAEELKTSAQEKAQQAGERAQRQEQASG